MAKIRALKPEDTDELYEIYLAAKATNPVPIGPQWTREQFGEECGYSGWIEVTSEHKVGSFVLYRDVGVANEISFLATARDGMRQGRMERLLKHLINSESPPKAVWLEVHEGNQSARRLYEKIGFAQVGKRPRYYWDGGAAILYNYG